MNTLDYLDWRGDLSFAQKPFNEVDNLILSHLAYLPLEGIVTSKNDYSVTLENVLEFFEKDPGKIPNNEVNPLALLRKAGISERFRKVCLGRYINRIDQDKAVQFSAVTFRLEDGSIFVAYRGTDATIVGWREDFNFAWSRKTVGQMDAVAYLNHIASENEGPIRVGGHSKGGHFAIYASAFVRQKVSDRILEIYSNDGPGFNKFVYDSEEYTRILPKIRKIIPESSVIGLMMSSREEMKVISSSAKGIQQHNPYSWDVLADHFVPADKLSTASVFLDGILDNWLASCTEEQRGVFITTVFDALESSGCRTFGDMKSNPWMSYNAVMKAASSLGKDRRRECFATLSKLALISRNAIWDEAQKQFSKYNLIGRISEKISDKISERKNEKNPDSGQEVLPEPAVRNGE